ncbi:hypothetical protein BD779DRAFT_1797047 [Infundibulicybe gibba]|nr:hypothetical protein BD779DRAFT_1797047 [Infundibulicybe gibba]
MQSQTQPESYGESLPDQVERIGALFDAHLQVISDVRELHKDRVALEREYAGKLQVLTRKAADRMSRTEVAIVVGDDPTKSYDANMLKKKSSPQALYTLNSAYNKIIESLTNTAQDHMNIADALTSQVIDVLKAIERKNDEAKKKELQFFQKLLAERDRVYNERLKNKQKYDEECGEVEAHRQKQGRAQDDKHSDRVAKQAEQQRNDMMNSKNIYLISTAIANGAKAKFYNEDLPALENQFQALQSRLTERFTKVLLHSQALQVNHLDILKARISSAENVLGQVNPARDQSLFIEYNIRQFTAPSDWKFEPCMNHYDTAEMSIEPAPKVFLQNKLNKCRSKLQELGPLMTTKQRELDQLAKLVNAYTANHSLGNIDEVSDNYLEAKHQLVFFATSERILKTEVETILMAIGDDHGGQHPHSFKSSSFSIPTQCGYCKSSIWGLSKQGKTCKLCGLSVHSKCELKVPADCQHSDGGRQSSLLSKSKSTASRTSTKEAPVLQTPTPSSFVHSGQSEDSFEETYPEARALFDYTATSEFELSINDGEKVQILEADDGSGWVKVANKMGHSGLVPASYVEEESSSPQIASPTAHQGPKNCGEFEYPRRQQRLTINILVRALYDYKARGTDELGLVEGEIVELTEGPAGGQNYAEGWWEGVNSKGRKGIFPSNYVGSSFTLFRENPFSIQVEIA